MDVQILSCENDEEALLNIEAFPAQHSVNADADAGDEEHRARRLPQMLTALSASLAGVAAGFVLGYSSPIIPELLQDGVLTVSNASWFASLPILTAIFGGPLAACVIGWFGLKLTIMASGPMAVTGWLIIAITPKVQVMLVGRALTGLAVGMTSLCVPMYIAEISSKDLRGSLGAIFQTSLTAGIFLTYCLGISLRRQWLAVASACIPSLCVILMVFMPESPRWLLKKNYSEDAMANLVWLRGPHYNIHDEYYEIMTAVSSQSARFHIKEFHNSVIYKPSIICLVLMAFQQLAGISVIGTYAQYILQDAGFTTLAKEAVILMGLVALIATVISCFIQDRTGRRKLLVLSGTLCGVSMAMLGTYFYLVKDMTVRQRGAGELRWLSLVSVLLYVAAFSLGLGPTVWLLVPELLPSRAKGFVASLATTVNWSVGFLVAKEFLDLQQLIGPHGTFWVYCGALLLGVLYIVIALPETQGRTLEEIQLHFQDST